MTILILTRADRTIMVRFRRPKICVYLATRKGVRGIAQHKIQHRASGAVQTSYIDKFAFWVFVHINILVDFEKKIVRDSF